MVCFKAFFNLKGALSCLTAIFKGAYLFCKAFAKGSYPCLRPPLKGFYLLFEGFLSLFKALLLRNSYTIKKKTVYVSPPFLSGHGVLFFR